jgi:hypothetical protein
MLSTVLLLAGCNTARMETPSAAPVGVTPSAAIPLIKDPLFDALLKARAAGQQVLAIAPEVSLVAITVRRGGTLSRLGHDHVIASHTVEGYVAPKLGKVALRFELDQMSVDEAGLREKAGLPPPPGSDAVFATRRNMLGPVLDVQNYPWLVVQAELAPNNPSMLIADVTLHGTTRRFSVPVIIEQQAGTLRAIGEFTAKQSEFNIKPFSVLGGALSVLDQIELRFDITAR